MKAWHSPDLSHSLPETVDCLKPAPRAAARAILVVALSWAGVLMLCIVVTAATLRVILSHIHQGIVHYLCRDRPPTVTDPIGSLEAQPSGVPTINHRLNPYME